MEDYYRLRLKLLTGSEGGSAFTLKSWIGIAGALLWVSMMIVGGAVRSPEAILAVAIVLALFFLGHVAEAYPRIGAWSILVAGLIGALLSGWFLAVTVLTTDATTSQVFSLSAFFLYFVCVFRAALVHRNVQLGRSSANPRILFVLAGVAAIGGFIVSVAAVALWIRVDGAWGWTLTTVGAIELVLVVLCVAVSVGNPLRLSSWLNFFGRLPVAVNVSLAVLYLCATAEAFVLNNVLELAIRYSLYVAWPLTYGTSALLLVWSGLSDDVFPQTADSQPVQPNGT